MGDGFKRLVTIFEAFDDVSYLCTDIRECTDQPVGEFIPHAASILLVHVVVLVFASGPRELNLVALTHFRISVLLISADCLCYCCKTTSTSHRLVLSHRVSFQIL